MSKILRNLHVSDMAVVTNTIKSLKISNVGNHALTLLNSTSQSVDYTLTLPPAQASSAGLSLLNDGSGGLSWSSPTRIEDVATNTNVDVSNTLMTAKVDNISTLRSRPRQSLFPKVRQTIIAHTGTTSTVGFTGRITLPPYTVEGNPYKIRFCIDNVSTDFSFYMTVRGGTIASSDTYNVVIYPRTLINVDLGTAITGPNSTRIVEATLPHFNGDVMYFFSGAVYDLYFEFDNSTAVYVDDNVSATYPTYTFGGLTPGSSPAIDNYFPTFDFLNQPWGTTLEVKGALSLSAWYDTSHQVVLSAWAQETYPLYFPDRRPKLNEYLTADDLGYLYWTTVGKLPSTSVTSTTTLAATTSLVKVDASGGDIVITLPAMASSDGLKLLFIRSDSSANAVTIAPPSGEVLDSVNGTVLMPSQYDRVELMGTDIGWYTI